MYNRTLWFAIIALLVCNDVYGKKTKRIKRPKDHEDLTTIQPNVIAYSTFGVNDVSSYNGFIPTSPEYSNFLSGNNQDSSTRLYAPAFPSAVDSTGFSENYGAQKNEEQPYAVNEKGTQYTSNSISGNQNKKAESEDNADDSDAPRYGSKLGNKYKRRPSYQINDLELDTSNRYLQPSDEKYYNFNEMQAVQDKPKLNELSSNYENTHSYKSNNMLQQDVNDFTKPGTSYIQNGMNYPRVVDFTKLGDEYYPTELDTSKLMSDSLKHSNTQMSLADFQIGNSFGNTGNANKFAHDSSTSYVERFNLENNEETKDKTAFKSNTLLEPSSKKNLAQYQKYDESSIKKTEQKRKMKYKPWDSGSYSNSYTDGMNSSSLSPVHGYEYSTNYSNMNFKYGVSDTKKPYFQDELLPSSSNIVDFTTFQFPEKDNNDYKKRPEFNNEGDYSGSSFKNKFLSSDYLNKFKNYLSDAPSTASSHWGSIFKTTDYSSFGEHPKKSPYNVNDIVSDDVVSIPKRPQKLYTKFSESKPIEWSSGPHTSQKLNKPTFDWTKDFLDTRYKSEEDLLNLRTHDTSRPSYIPNFNDYDSFKQLSEKWKENYINSKYKDTLDNFGYWSEKPDYVPVAKPHQIEVPHPVIVPVPHPFPVRVPISKPVAVPVLQELTVPIEKPVPYPVYKNVPYPVEKLIPVPVEKEVPVPVEKPYPVHIPHVRPVFHHTKPVYEEPESSDGEDYLPRPEFRKPSQYKKKPTYSVSRYRTRRPTRASYQDRNRRRWPDRRRPSTYTRELEHNPRPQRYQHSTSNRHREYDHEVEDDEYRSYSVYCKKTGKC